MSRVRGGPHDRHSVGDQPRVAHTRPPAKLNLFLELLARRDDGFHEIDTVMVPVDWCDQLRVARTDRPGVELTVDWLPSPQVVARRIGLDRNMQAQSCSPNPTFLQNPSFFQIPSYFQIPSDERNLVHKALRKFALAFGIQGGFECKLGKSIPPGAGMGGASSDAASALLSAAALCGIPQNSPKLLEIAAEIGSDVTFFLGLAGKRLVAGRAQGRGELLSGVALQRTIFFVVVFPGVVLSTASVYAASQVSPSPENADRLIASMEGRSDTLFEHEMLNRLTQPAKKLAPQINETLESLWHTGLRTSQLTGSGSACFAVASTQREANRCAARLRSMVEPGAVVMAVKTTSVPIRVDMI